MWSYWNGCTWTNRICVDSYHDGILEGRLYSAAREGDHFSSLSQFLIKLEELLDSTQQPQAYTEIRRFAPVEQSWAGTGLSLAQSRGRMATFDLKVLFRRNSSWQGLLLWRETEKEHSFRSVLELVLLMDSALRGDISEEIK